MKPDCSQLLWWFVSSKCDGQFLVRNEPLIKRRDREPVGDWFVTHYRNRGIRRCGTFFDDHERHHSLGVLTNRLLLKAAEAGEVAQREAEKELPKRLVR
jgi:hypothetical protein